jgi:hypothetical protein
MMIGEIVRFFEEDIWNTWGATPNIIGVAKSFRKDPLFQLGGKAEKTSIQSQGFRFWRGKFEKAP